PRASARGAPAASRFALEVPSCGILSLSVDGIGLDEIRERQAAVFTAESTRENVFRAAMSELPGFEDSSAFGEASGAERAAEASPAGPAPTENLEGLWN